MDSNDKKTNNNKVRVCGFAVMTNLVLFALVCFAFVLPWIGGTNDTFTLWVFVTLLVVLIVVSLMLIYSFITMWPVVVIDERGLHKSLLGIFFRKTILWQEIRCVRNIKTIGSHAIWVFFSKSDISGMGISRCRLRRDNIYFMYSSKLQNLVKHFYGKDISLNAAAERIDERNEDS